MGRRFARADGGPLLAALEHRRRRRPAKIDKTRRQAEYGSGGRDAGSAFLAHMAWPITSREL
jgi:hypothetical protein